MHSARRNRAHGEKREVPRLPEHTHKNQSNSFSSCGAISPVARGSSKHTLSSATFSSSIRSVTLLVSARKASGEAPRATSCSAA